MALIRRAFSSCTVASSSCYLGTVRHVTSSIKSKPPSSDFDRELLSVLASSARQQQQEQQQQQQQAPRSATADNNTRNAAADEDLLMFARFLQTDFVSSPRVTHPTFPFVVPAKWVDNVRQTVQSHFRICLMDDHDASSSLLRATRPGLFLQCFVHPSFLREAPTRRNVKSDFVGQQQSEEDSRSACTMGALADVGAAVLSITINSMAPLLLSASSSEKNQTKRGASSSFSNKMILTVPTVQDESLGVAAEEGKEKTQSSSSVKRSNADNDSVIQQNSRTEAFLESRHVLRHLEKATQDHPLSLVCFNVWKCSDLVLSDAGIYGLRDALGAAAARKSGRDQHPDVQDGFARSGNKRNRQFRGGAPVDSSNSSTSNKAHLPSLPLPAAAMCVRAVVGAVYLNFGLDAAVVFCQKHVLVHAVDMVESSN